MTTWTIIFKGKVSGADETTFEGTLAEARACAASMVGEPIVMEDGSPDVVEAAYVADDC
jgi:hypothetical protein